MRSRRLHKGLFLLAMLAQRMLSATSAVSSATSLSSSLLLLSEEAAVKRLSSHLLLRDYRSAMNEARELVRLHPDSLPLQLMLLRSLCAQGEEIEALAIWDTTTAQSPSIATTRDALETLAWGVLRRGGGSEQMIIRMYALMGVARTGDVRALPLLLEEMRSSSAPLRALAVQIGGHMGDLPIRQELIRLLCEERTWYVRLEVIGAIGSLQMLEQLPDLYALLASPRTSAEEREAVILAVAAMLDSLPREQLEALCAHSRSGLRQLACELIGYWEVSDALDLLVPILSDPVPEVRGAALHALALLPAEVARRALPEVRAHLDDLTPEVAVGALRTLLLLDAEGEQEALWARWWSSPSPRERRMAAAALASTGRRGVPLMKQLLDTSGDPFVVGNVALGLLGQRRHVTAVCDQLFALFFRDGAPELMWERGVLPGLSILAPSEVRHVPWMPRYPHLSHQMARIELLSALCLGAHPGAQGALRSLLVDEAWGVTAAAATVLLQEGEAGAWDIVRALLDDPEEAVRVQAACILALMGGSDEALEVLSSSFAALPREVRMQVLQVLAQRADPSSVPILLKTFREPFQILRMAAASALIQCLYH